MREWIDAHRALLGWMGISSLVMFVGSLMVVPLLVARIPTDYFMPGKPPPESWRRRHPALRLLVVIVKNLFGAVFVAAGTAMLFTPGQGVLTILIGVTLLNFPGKRALELRIVKQPAVLQAINWMRAKANRPRLQLPQCVGTPPEHTDC